jgi:hypothetical protein
VIGRDAPQSWATSGKKRTSKPSDIVCPGGYELVAPGVFDRTIFPYFLNLLQPC